MGFWDNVADGFKSGMMRKGPNYVAKQRAARAQLEGLMAQIAVEAYNRSLAQRGRDLQYLDNDFRVEVKNGYDRDHRCPVTDILIFPRDGSGDRYHVIIDEDGNELYRGYHQK